MQTIKVKDVEVKTGEKNGTAWTKYTIHGEDGSQVATFNANASSLKSGDTINAEVVVEGKYTNLKSFSKVGGTAPVAPPRVVPIDEVEKIFADKPKPSLPSGNKDKEIREAVAVKAVVEMAGNGCLNMDDPIDARLLKAVKQWCTDALSGYLAPQGSDTPKTENKPPVAQGDERDNAVDKKMLFSLVKSNMKLTSDKSVCTWLENVAKVDMARLDIEAGVVFREISEKQGWN